MRKALPKTQAESAAFRYEKKFTIEGMIAADVLIILKPIQQCSVNYIQCAM